MSPGDIYVHLPSTMYGFESWDEPLLTLWAERVVDVDQVPRVIRDVQEVRADLVTSTLTLRFDKGEVAESLQSLSFGNSWPVMYFFSPFSKAKCTHTDLNENLFPLNNPLTQRDGWKNFYS